MTRSEILEKMTEICRDIFEDDSLIITETTTAADVKEWDSLSHLTLINEFEETFGIAFTLDEVKESENVGELLTAVMKHLEQKAGE